MKNLLLLSTLFLFIACQKENIDTPQLQQAEEINLLSIQVLASGCNNNNVCTVDNVSDADVLLFAEEADRSNDANILFSRTTNRNGIASFMDLEPGKYYLKVECEYGKKNMNITMQEGKRLNITVEF